LMEETDEMLYEKPENCIYTRMELVLRQYRHLSFHGKAQKRRAHFDGRTG